MVPSGSWHKSLKQGCPKWRRPGPVPKKMTTLGERAEQIKHKCRVQGVKTVLRGCNVAGFCRSHLAAWSIANATPLESVSFLVSPSKEQNGAINSTEAVCESEATAGGSRRGGDAYDGLRTITFIQSCPRTFGCAFYRDRIVEMNAHVGV